MRIRNFVAIAIAKAVPAVMDVVLVGSLFYFIFAVLAVNLLSGQMFYCASPDAACLEPLRSAAYLGLAACPEPTGTAAYLGPAAGPEPTGSAAYLGPAAGPEPLGSVAYLGPAACPEPLEPAAYLGSVAYLDQQPAQSP
eukprot:gene9848-7735_t